MSKDLKDTMSELEDTMKKVEGLANARVNDAKTLMKRLVVQTVVAILVTVAIYFFKGTAWYFWVSFAITLIMVVALILGLYVIRKTDKMMKMRD